MTTTRIICPPPPAINEPIASLGTAASYVDSSYQQGSVHGSASDGGQVSGPGGSVAGAFASPAWQGWFAQFYNQTVTQVGATSASAAAALAAANAAIAALPTKLNNSAADVLSGAVSVQTAGGFVAGTLTWDSTGTRTGGYGVAMTQKGIAGYNAGGTPTFAIDSAGNAYFAGALGAASGTFAGTLSAVNGTFTGSLVGVNGTFTGTLSAGTISGSINNSGGTITGGTFQTASSGQRAVLASGGLTVWDNSGSTIIFQADVNGVYANKPVGSVAAAGTFQTASNTGSAPAVSAASTGTAASITTLNLSGGDALHIDGPVTMPSRAAGVSNSTMNSIIAAADNAYQCGYTNGTTIIGRWANVYAANGTIQTSDARTKENIAECEFGLAELKALPARQFTMIVGQNIVSEGPDGKPVVTPRKGERTHYGFLAQEVKAVIGERNLALWSLEDRENPDSTQALMYTEFIPWLWKAVQELSAEVEELKAEVAVLKGGA